MKYGGEMGCHGIVRQAQVHVSLMLVNCSSLPLIRRPLGQRGLQ